MCIVVLIFSSSVSQSSCLKADSSFIWEMTTHNRFVVLFTSEFYCVLKQNSYELLAMKHKLNYSVEVGSKLTTIFIFFHSQNQRAKAGSMAFRSQNFQAAMYLAAGSFEMMRCSQPPQSEIIEVFNQRTTM